MTAPKQTVVIGAGAIGLSIAWRLAQAGQKVRVFERDTPGSGASGAAAGMLAPLAEIDFVEEALIALKQASLDLYPGFAAELTAASGVDLDLRTFGTLVVAIDRDDAESLRQHFDHRRRLGLAVDWLSGNEARALEPFLSPRIQAAVHIPTDHQIDNVKLVQALKIAAERAGATIESGVEVNAIETENDALRGLATSIGSVQTDCAVLAAGCWSRAIDGMARDVAPPVRPVKGQMLAVKMPEAHVLTRVVRAPECYLVPRSDGRLIIGATSEEMGFDTRLTAGGLFELLRGAYETLPVTAELEVIDTWVGLRPGSLDNDPILGHTRIHGLVMATGHYRNGILLTPITAAAVAEAVITGQDPDTIAPFSPRRFS